MDEEIAEIERKLPSHFSSFGALNNADSQDMVMLLSLTVMHTATEESAQRYVPRGVPPTKGTPITVSTPP